MKHKNAVRALLARWSGRITLVLAAAMTVLLAGCMFIPIEGSGVLITSRYELSGFSKITVDQACQLHVVPDASYSVTVTCDDNVLPTLTVERNGPDGITIGLRQGYTFSHVTFAAEVHMPVLTALQLSGASQARVEPSFSSNVALFAGISGASQADVPSVTCGPLSVEISGASRLTLGGAAARETLSVSGASTVDLLGCAAARADVTLSGASQVSLDVGSGPVTLSASGASTLYYRGSPQISVMELSGASRIIGLN